MEIAESLITSWLKHIKKCRLIQQNWKSSKNWIEKLDRKEFEEIFTRLNTEFDNIFRGKYDTIIKQAEIDVLGLSLDNGGNLFMLSMSLFMKMDWAMEIMLIG